LWPAAAPQQDVRYGGVPQPGGEVTQAGTPGFLEDAAPPERVVRSVEVPADRSVGAADGEIHWLSLLSYARLFQSRV
jgi:hypothetical protein